MNFVVDHNIIKNVQNIDKSFKIQNKKIISHF